MITISIGGVDRTDLIKRGSVEKKEAINQIVDTLAFDILYHTGQTYRPEAGDEVVMIDDDEVVFGGRVLTVDRQDLGNGSALYSVACKDYSFDLDRTLINEGYQTEIVSDIIDDLLTIVATETGITFTFGGSIPLIITKITFDRIPGSAALQKLADLTGYSWYVDYDKVIHFFPKNSEPAPFDAIPGGGDVIDGSLSVSKDLSQIRNRVFIKGGEIEGEERTETFDGNGAKKFFKLSNKFSSLPTVVVDSGTQTVGVDFLDNEADFDCFWDFNQQYIRFKDSTIPASGTDNIEVTGNPLYNLVVQVEEPVSIDAHGIFEYAKTDKTLKSREEAVSLAKAELSAYKDGVVEGSFQTYTPGLRAGQVIRVTSAALDVDEDFLIQRTSFRMISPEKGIWSVQLATLRSVSIIDFLIGLLNQGDRLIQEQGEVVLEKTVFPLENITIDDEIDINTDDEPVSETMELDEDLYPQALNFDIEFVAGPYTPDPSDAGDTKRVFILDGSPLA